MMEHNYQVKNGYIDLKKRIEKLDIEKAKVLEGILRTLFFVLIADAGGTLTLILNFQKYNPNLALIFIVLGVFIGFGLIFSIIVIAFKLEKIMEE